MPRLYSSAALVARSADHGSADSVSGFAETTDAQQDNASVSGSQQGGAQQREQPHTAQQNKQRQAP